MRGRGGRSGGVTSHDVADQAGVSQATVARAFASPDKVAEATRTRVYAAAERLGYVPNAIARSLKAQRTHMIGAVVPATGEYWQHVVTQFSRGLTERGRQLLLFSFSEAGQVADVIKTVAKYRLDGLIAASANIDAATLDRISGSALPVVAFNQPAAQGRIPSVTVDNEAGMRDLAAHVVRQGARSAVFIGGRPNTSTDELRLTGTLDQLRSHNVPCRHISAGEFSYEAGYKIAAHVADHPLPDAVIVGSDEVAFGVIDGLRERDIHAPRDVLLTGFDGLPQSRWVGYDLTTLEQPTELLVDHALTLLLDPAPASAAEPRTKSHKATSIVVPGTIRQGRTTDNA